MGIRGLAIAVLTPAHPSFGLDGESDSVISVLLMKALVLSDPSRLIRQILLSREKSHSGNVGVGLTSRHYTRHCVTFGLVERWSGMSALLFLCWCCAQTRAPIGLLGRKFSWWECVPIRESLDPAGFGATYWAHGLTPTETVLGPVGKSGEVQYSGKVL